MRTKLRKMTLGALLAGLAAVVLAPPAEARRQPPTTTTTQPGYVPPPQYGQDPHPAMPDDDPYGNPVEPTVVPVDLPAAPDPGAGLAGGGDPLGPAPSDATTPAPAAEPEVVGQAERRPEVPATNDAIFGGILSRTGAETLPLARAGLAALTLGGGLVLLARRRRPEPASA